ncbi:MULTISPECIES: DUF937 domain-containing protein [unclassified Streptomyces]|uniref:DUF937 domain-containing protein n=1 Tax=unclassified Streptomyces TaxID=2593676 RepID=UPI002DDBA30F|nr:DUF937 domain-containing protein [Streptomyces sp. NBC_01445]WSE07097.1 DUF937 domain-containing protein [Streptomyces sp. NBC_01445]
MSENTGSAGPSLQKDVLDELGDDRLSEIAGLLGTDAAGAQDVVSTTVSELSGGLREKATADPQQAEEVRQALAETEEQQPLQGVATFGGLGSLAGGGLMAGILAKMSRPVATAVAKKTGLPPATVTRVIELLVPVVLAVFTKRSAGRKAGRGPL